VGPGNVTTLELEKSSDYVRFIEKDFDFILASIRKLFVSPTEYTQASNMFIITPKPVHTPISASSRPLLKTDPDEIIAKKIRMVAKYLDILVSRRIMNFRAIDYSTMQYAMFILMKDIRGAEPKILEDKLISNLSKEKEEIGSQKNFALTKMNRKNIQYLLARITDYVELQSGSPSSHFVDYTSGEGTKKFEVEHVWANHYDQHSHEFDQISDFEGYRNRFGAFSFSRSPLMQVSMIFLTKKSGSITRRRIFLRGPFTR